MFSYINVKTNLLYLFLIVIIAIYIYEPPKHKSSISEVESAINRAKTKTCKRELEEFSDRLRHHNIPPQLHRSCKLDLNVPRNIHVGCVLNNSSRLIQLEEAIVNSSYCLDSCFSYGHSYGGFNGSCCFCGDNLVADRISAAPCNKTEEFDWYKTDNGIFRPTPFTPEADGDQVQKEIRVRIAFLLIFNGRSLMQIQRLLRNIYSEEHVYYIHVDKRDDYLVEELSDQTLDFKNIIIAKSRFNTVWGGPTLLRMIIDAMRHLSVYRWDYMINLSESDFPIKPLSMLQRYLKSSSRAIYLKSHNIKGYNFIRKQGLDRNFYQCEDRVWRMGKRFLPHGIVYSGGSDWFALPSDFCNYISSNLENSDTLVKPLLQLFNYTLLPAESFFHTLALNSEFCDRYIDQNLRITNWHRSQGCKCQHTDVVDWCGCSPHAYRWSDWEKLKQTNSSKNLFFSRKFDPTISTSIIESVEKKLVQRNWINEAEYDTRYWQNIYDNRKLHEHLKSLGQFGLFAINQIQNIQVSSLVNKSELRSINLHFDNDRFAGLIYEYCDRAECAQVLIERNSSSHLQSYNSKCFIPNKRALKVIEVNQGFDTGERMFRDHKPLHVMSNIVVYHEWLVDLSNNSFGPPNVGGFKYSWWSPNNQLELVQSIKLKGSRKPTKLSLAHRLNIASPIKSGVWTLIISRNNLDCLEYRFPVFDESSYIRDTISLDQFNRFYSVRESCLISYSNTTQNYPQQCENKSWSLASYNQARKFPVPRN